MIMFADIQIHQSRYNVLRAIQLLTSFHWSLPKRFQSITKFLGKGKSGATGTEPYSRVMIQIGIPVFLEAIM